MQSVDGDIFDGANLAPGCPLHGGDAGTDGLAILVDRTGAAERHAAAELGSGERQNVAQIPEQRHIGFTVKLNVGQR